MMQQITRSSTLEDQGQESEDIEKIFNPQEDRSLNSKASGGVLGEAAEPRV